jgi:hypothetical protein
LAIGRKEGAMTARVVRTAHWAARLAAVVSSGCFFGHNYAALSSGPVGCPPQEVVISDHEMQTSSETWVATCRGQRFFCSGMGTTVTCAPDAAGAAWSAPAPVAATPPASPPPVVVPPPVVAPAVMVVILAPEDAAPAEGAGSGAPPLRESPARAEVQAALAAARDRLLVCTTGVPSSIQTEIEFRGSTGKVLRVTVTTDRGVDVATCVGQALLDVALVPFALESITISYPWQL